MSAQGGACQSSIFSLFFHANIILVLSPAESWISAGVVTWHLLQCKQEMPGAMGGGSLSRQVQHSLSLLVTMLRKARGRACWVHEITIRMKVISPMDFQKKSIPAPITPGATVRALDKWVLCSMRANNSLFE